MLKEVCLLAMGVSCMLGSFVQPQRWPGLWLASDVKRVNTAGVRPLSLERHACKVGHGLLSGNMTGKSSPILISAFPYVIRVSCCTSMLCTNGVVCAEHLLSFWESGILVHARQSASMTSPNENHTC
jgi:hypothetical protein